MKDIESLLSGTDVRGVNSDLTPEVAYKIGAAFCQWLGAKKTIALGRDCRLNGKQLLNAFCAGVLDSGFNTINFGIATTPAMFMSLVFFSDESIKNAPNGPINTPIDNSVMITASHLPSQWNGIKFFTKDGGLESNQVREILKIAACKTCPYKTDPATGFLIIPKEHDAAIEKTFDLMTPYSLYLKSKIKTSLSRLHIVIDAGNGCAGFFQTMLNSLNADTSGSQYLTPDGTFPAHIPNPEDVAAMESIKKAVLDNHADLGLIFDTDVDRMSCVLSDGSEVNRDSIIALVAAIIAPNNHGATIVTDSVTSNRLTRFLESLGYKHLRYKRGYKNVIDKMKELNGYNGNSSPTSKNSNKVHCPLAMETSGHGALAQNYYLDDGAYLATIIIDALATCKSRGEPLNALISGLPPLIEERVYRLKITTPDFIDYGKNVLKTFEERASQKGYTIADSFEGVRLEFSNNPKGWALLRMSLHEAVMPLNIESEHLGDILILTKIIKELLAGFNSLDTTAI